MLNRAVSWTLNPHREAVLVKAFDSDFLHDLSILLMYDRVLEVITQLGRCQSVLSGGLSQRKQF